MSDLETRWLGPLSELCDRMREAARGALWAAVRSGAAADLARVVSQGAGDQTYAIDQPTEEVLSVWLEEQARRTPLSILTEDAGWRHMGPGPQGARELAGFDHGGPRIVVDPIDGTRNLMTDLRSAFSVVALAGPGASAPRQADVKLGLLAEIPTTRAASWRRLHAVRGGQCWWEEHALLPGFPTAPAQRIQVDQKVRVDHAYFPFFKYMADLRAPIASIEAAFLARLAAHEGADIRNCYDDQYISNAGQLVQLIEGRYRMIADLRAWLAQLRGQPTLTTKPYDIAGALICAQAAGCCVLDPLGAELDFPLDTSTPLSFVGWHNAATQQRLAPHLAAVLPR